MLTMDPFAATWSQALTVCSSENHSPSFHLVLYILLDKLTNVYCLVALVWFYSVYRRVQTLFACWHNTVANTFCLMKLLCLLLEKICIRWLKGTLMNCMRRICMFFLSKSICAMTCLWHTLWSLLCFLKFIVPSVGMRNNYIAFWNLWKDPYPS